MRDYLAAHTQVFDAIYSVWGAVWFTDPEQLLPLVVESLTPCGVLCFGQAEPAPGVCDPQPMRGKWLEHREHELTVLRRQYAPEARTGLPKRHGLTDIHASVLEAPEPGKLGTLPVQARTCA
ncbi:hypothetical protein [Streptomyces xinghaiensis]|uniref:hypothetical protein n=1 Tax=Streptomyces xinghaiensis TaxID=1038928 RepID=UPI002E0ED683|nr:hypothetical protein OG463_22895 [Streptomyces xinghaiensis]